MPVGELRPVPQHMEQPAHRQLLTRRLHRRLVIGKRCGREPGGPARQREAELQAGLAARLVVEHRAAAHLAHAGQVVRRFVVIAGGRMTRARARPARQHIAILPVRDVEGELGSLAAFAMDRAFALVGFAQQELKFIAFGHAAAEHTVSLDHWGISNFSRSTLPVRPLAHLLRLTRPRMGALGQSMSALRAPQGLACPGGGCGKPRFGLACRFRAGITAR